MEEEADSSRIRPAPVRVVARICPGGTGSFQVTVDASSSAAVVSLLPRHEDHAPRRPGGAAAPRDKGYDYRLHCCYPKDDSCRIFHSEVKPLVDAIFTAGANSCVVACGAAAKTNLIMGQEQGQPTSLLTMAMEQILLLSHTIGAVVSISSYQVLQDIHVFDLLEPKDSEVLVLDGADGRTKLKGLSKVHVKSIQEFVDLCSRGTSVLKHSAKPSAKPSDHTQPSSAGRHRGFIIYVSRFDQEDKECALAKMHFLDLADYVDSKQKTNGGGLPNCNKSMYALMNVVQALNSNQSFIPYRQSRLTRILQDSLCKTNRSVLITCLDEHSSQGVVSTLSLASRSSQAANEQCYKLSLGMRRFSKSNHQPSSALDKHSQPKFNNSAAKASRTPAADKRSKIAMHSTKKTASSLSTCVKQRVVKTALSGRKLFCTGTNLSKEDKIVAASAEVTKAEVLQSSPGREIQGSLPAEECDEMEKVLEVVSCSMEEPISSSMQEDDSSSSVHTDHLCTNLKEMCSSDVADDIVQKTSSSEAQSSPKLTDRLREISNSLKLLSTMPVSVTKQKPDMVGVQDFYTDSPEPKTPAIHLKSGHAEGSHELLKARSTGVKKTLAKECLTFLNSANKEELKSLKGIGEKRANYILELREESPELFKEIDDLKNIIGMNKREIKTLMSGMVMDL